jgi:hypothetical protein
VEKGHNRLGSRDERSLYRAGSLSALARALLRYKLDIVGEGRLGGTKREIIFFSVEKETKIINCEQDILYTTEQYQQLRE